MAKKKKQLDKKPKKRSIKLIQKELWELCKKIIRKKYGNTCYTCGHKDLFGYNWHTGHCFPKAYVDPFLKYDLRNLRPQCYRCNMRLGGMGAMFFEHLLLIEGQEYIDKLMEDLCFRRVEKPYDFYLKKLDEYKNIWSKM